MAQHVGEIIKGFPPAEPAFVPTISDMLRRYAEALTPWAESVASRMLNEVKARDDEAWRDLSESLSDDIRREILSAPTGEVMRDLLAQQVTLIKSIPTEAAQRVHEMTIKAIEDGSRHGEMVAEIMRSGDVAKSRALLIARTETARTASVLTEARAKHVGSDGYIWRCAHDADVRSSHKAMNGKFVPWGSPPTLDGLTGHAGCLPNCRCYPDPVIPDD